ncbi:Elongator complex protein 5 [Ceratocystis platani]|uniref:Elongator complex protein 5 n=1 Tax=Ceratocystis fimbriata f. sp. platani TaxID=88771 RepID=A0A0F8B0W6_CERFI|nr:Elongator complex protein 5 [Ceratocystis platani]
MAPSAKDHHRSKSLLLLQKLLNLRDGASPLTLVVDSLEQTAGPVLKEFAARAKISQAKVIFVSFTTLKKPPYAHAFVPAWGCQFTTLRPRILAHCPAIDKAAVKAKTQQRAIIIVDSLNAVINNDAAAAVAFLSSLITPTASLVGVYHSDAPTPTAILRLRPLAQEVACAAARDRALAEPEFGLREGKEGVLLGLRDCASAGVAVGSGLATVSGSPTPTGCAVGTVIEMELRRKSGRQVSETFVLCPRDATDPRASSGLGMLVLRDEHPLLVRRGASENEGETNGDEVPQSTFSMGLTDKQKRDRSDIVLPYFDAQIDVGGGEGGRILYDMGREDDFDDEEDEI